MAYTIEHTRGRSRIQFRSDGYSNSGTDVAYSRGRGLIVVGGWYDSMVGIEPQEISLHNFLVGLGITEADVKKALHGK